MEQIKALIEAGEVSVDGVVRADPALKVRAGGAVVLAVPPAEDAAPMPEAIELAETAVDENEYDAAQEILEIAADTAVKARAYPQAGEARNRVG